MAQSRCGSFTLARVKGFPVLHRASSLLLSIIRRLHHLFWQAAVERREAAGEIPQQCQSAQPCPGPRRRMPAEELTLKALLCGL